MKQKTCSKKTKKDLFKMELWKIARQDKSMDSLYADFEDFINTQIILKRPGKFFKRPSDRAARWLVLIIEHEAEKYMGAESKPRYECEYVSHFVDRVWGLRDKWNYDYHLPFVAEYQLYSTVSAIEKRLKKRFAELNPLIAEANALLEASVRMYAKGFVNPCIDERLKELTNNYDAEVIANLPFVVGIVGKLRAS